MTKNTKRAKANRYVAILNEDDTFVNLAGRYEYLELPYYVSQDYEHSRLPIRPTCKEMLDAYIVPLFLERAKLAGLDVPEYYVTNGYFEAPAIVDSINPFMSRSRTVLKMSQQKSVSKSITRNFTYAACVQEIPPEAQIEHFRAVLGWSVAARYRDSAEKIWRLFQIPLARVRVLRTYDDRILLSKISPLLYRDLKQRELEYLEKKIRWEE